MTETPRTALLFLVNTLFSFYLFLLMIRLLLVWVRSDYFNPLSRFVTQLTNPLIKPLRRLIPNVGQIEIASVIGLLVLELIKFFLLTFITAGILPNPFGIGVLALADALKLLIDTFFYAILIQALLSWIQPNSPLIRVLYQMTSPLMRPLQRIIPPVGGFDISPIPAIILLQLLLILLVSPLTQLGTGITFG